MHMHGLEMHLFPTQLNLPPFYRLTITQHTHSSNPTHNSIHNSPLYNSNLLPAASHDASSLRFQFPSSTCFCSP